MKTLIKIIDRLTFALKMFPTKNPQTRTNEGRIFSTAYPDGSIHHYPNGIYISEIKRKKVFV